MHYPTVILTQAEQQEEAHDKAIQFANELLLTGDYDYFNANGERWEESGKTYALASEAGKRAVELALTANRRTFDMALHAARMMLQEFTDEQIYQEDFGEGERNYLPSRWQFGQVYDATPYIYGDHDVWGGEAIRNDTDYQAATENQGNLWVTCLDFHG
jgi:hypothetical protein